MSKRIKHSNSNKFSEEEIVSILKTLVADDGDFIRSNAYHKMVSSGEFAETLPSMYMIVKKFGSWNNMLKKLRDNNTSITIRKSCGWTKEEVKKAVGEVIKKEKRYINIEDYKELQKTNNLPSQSTITKQFGGYINLLKEINVDKIDYRVIKNEFPSDKDAYISLILKFVDDNNIKNYGEYVKLSKGRPDVPSVAGIKKVLGSWAELSKYIR